MIIFYNRNTGNIIGTIEGRVHPKENLNIWIQPSNIPRDDIGKYVVPFKIKEGKEKTGELEPDVPFSDLIYDFESGKKKILHYKIILDKKGKTVGFKEK